MIMKKTSAWASTVLMLAACAAPAAAKVVFTGYGDFQFTPLGRFRIDGPPAILSGFGLGSGVLETRGNTINALGLFATTALNEKAKLQMDVTYKGIASTVKTLTVQYAYVEYADFGGTARLGKITIPFNYYNEKKFYPFQHASITAPNFQSSILGLPIADVGAAVSRPFDVGAGFTLKADLYGVNGYGPTPGSTTTFRNGGVPSNALTIANNVGSSDANHDVAFGARLELSHSSLPNSSAGVSYYHDRWDPQGQKLFQMGGAHLHLAAGGFDWLSEALMLNAKGDAGMVQTFGSPDWRTDGFFSELDYLKLMAWDKAVTPWVRYEDYLSHAVGGGGGKERLTNIAGGVSVALTEGVLAKFQATDLYYRLPYQGQGDLKIDGYSFATALTVTF